MASFFDNLSRFFGGLAGDVRTNSGLNINTGLAESAEKDMREGRSESGPDAVGLNLSWKDNNGKSRNALLYVPMGLYNDNIAKAENAVNGRDTAFGVLGAELDNGVSLDSAGVKKLLNDLDKKKNQVKLTYANSKDAPTFTGSAYTSTMSDYPIPIVTGEDAGANPRNNSPSFISQWRKYKRSIGL